MLFKHILYYYLHTPEDLEVPERMKIFVDDHADRFPSSPYHHVSLRRTTFKPMYAWMTVAEEHFSPRAKIIYFE
jgi:hypothetical protein